MFSAGHVKCFALKLIFRVVKFTIVFYNLHNHHYIFKRLKMKNIKSRKTGLSPPVFFTNCSKAVPLLWFIFICYVQNVCLLHDFVATLRLSALPSALYFVLSKLAL